MSSTTEKAARFIPEDFSVSTTDKPSIQGPFKALKVDGSDKCLAANICDGTLTLKEFDALKPHPGTMFIMSEIFWPSLTANDFLNFSSKVSCLRKETLSDTLA